VRVLKRVFPQNQAAAWLLVAAVATQLGFGAAPTPVASQQATNYTLTSKILQLGPGHFAVRGYVTPNVGGVTVTLDRRACATCDWVSGAKVATRADGHYDFRVDAPSRDAVHYRVEVPNGTTQPAFSGAFRVDPLPETLDGNLPYWGEPVWRDEFEGSQIDGTKWRVLDNETLSWDKASIYKEQAKLREGKLVITAKRVDPATDRHNRAWATGYLDSRGGRFSQRYGRFEVMARLPTRRWDSRGLWPSFWLRDDSGTGEIDVMEAWGTPSAKPGEEDPGNYAWAVHSDTMGGGTSVKSWGLPRTAPSIASGFYRYAVEWTPDGITMFIDDQKVGYISKSANPWLVTSFPTKANIRMQLAVGSSYWGVPDDTTQNPAEYVIEYVRVWKYPGS
jgi:beta-glucanase (GH16 family)